MSEKYTRRKLLGEGAYGIVYKAVRKKDGLNVAMKRMKLQNAEHGASPSAIREIKHLQKLNHPNVIRLFDVFSADSSIHMLLELCPTDLDHVIKDKSILMTEGHVKSYTQMMLAGLEHCHANFVLHRDLKPENLLISTSGEVKLADFGLAKSFPTSGKMTSEVATIWYRPPELLFGARHYSAAVDVWAAGCIFAELMLRNPMFQAQCDSSVEQLQRIFNVLGTPTDKSWPNVNLLPNYVEFEERTPLDLRDFFVRQFGAPETALELLMRLLELDPRVRLSCGNALKHEYFTSGADATPLDALPHANLLKKAAAADLAEDDDEPTKKRVRR
jgi:cyclin-dependent kinase 7